MELAKKNQAIYIEQALGWIVVIIAASATLGIICLISINVWGRWKESGGTIAAIDIESSGDTRTRTTVDEQPQAVIVPPADMDRDTYNLKEYQSPDAELQDSETSSGSGTSSYSTLPPYHT
ncbi:hypothetical protein N7540_007105 [Penicillium herquei]|nr:hypothetical protein N7540_007105 [Penicillium herquei]